MPIEIGDQIIWVEVADEEQVPKSDENNLVLDFPGPLTPVHGNKKSLKCSPQLTKENLKKKAESSQNSVKPSIAEIQRNHRVQAGLVQLENLRKKAKNKVEKAENSQNSAKPSKAEIQENCLVQLENLRKKAKNKVEKAENSQNSAKPSKPEEVEAEVQKIPSQVFENQEFLQLTKKKAELDKKAKKDKKAEIKTITEDPFGKWEKLEDNDIFDIPIGPIKLLTLTPNSFGPRCFKKRNVKRQAGL